jgi:membrane protease YdiL (CAAX protease family)
MPDAVSPRLALAFAALASTGLLALGWAIARARRGRELVGYEPRRAVPWNGWHVLGVVGLWMLFQIVVAVYVRAIYGKEPDPARSLTLQSLGSVIFVCTAIAGLHSVGATSADLGLRFDKLRRDVLYGVTAFFVSLVPIYALLVLLSSLLPEQPPHPIVKLLTKDASALNFAICIISAVIIAPIAEEFLFRAVFQGWLERARWSSSFGWSSSFSLPEAEAGVDATNPYRSPATQARTSEGLDKAEETARLKPELQPVPIVISSLCFAAVHFPQGIAPFPLFLLALALGYLYERTHRILAPIVLHACFNACSLGLLWLQVA